MQFLHREINDQYIFSISKKLKYVYGHLNDAVN